MSSSSKKRTAAGFVKPATADDLLARAKSVLGNELEQWRGVDTIDDRLKETCETFFPFCNDEVVFDSMLTIMRGTLRTYMEGRLAARRAASVAALAELRADDIQLQRRGTGSSNVNPSNHLPAQSTKLPFNLQEIPLTDAEKTEIVSQFMSHRKMHDDTIYY